MSISGQSIKNMNKDLIIEAIGWYGMAAILLAYLLVSFGFLSVGDIFYQVLNFTGAAGVAYTSFKKKAKQLAVLNIIWAIIALVAIIRIII